MASAFRIFLFSASMMQDQSSRFKGFCQFRFKHTCHLLYELVLVISIGSDDK